MPTICSKNIISSKPSYPGSVRHTQHALVYTSFIIPCHRRCGKELAEERGISLSRLSRIADVSYKTVQAMFRHPEQGFNTKTLERIANALHVEMGDLFENVPDE